MVFQILRRVTQFEECAFRPHAPGFGVSDSKATCLMDSSPDCRRVFKVVQGTQGPDTCRLYSGKVKCTWLALGRGSTPRPQTKNTLNLSKNEGRCLLQQLEKLLLIFLPEPPQRHGDPETVGAESIWVVVNFRVPFWVPLIIGAVL